MGTQGRGRDVNVTFIDQVQVLIESKRNRATMAKGGRIFAHGAGRWQHFPKSPQDMWDFLLADGLRGDSEAANAYPNSKSDVDGDFSCHSFCIAIRPANR